VALIETVHLQEIIWIKSIQATLLTVTPSPLITLFDGFGDIRFFFIAFPFIVVFMGRAVGVKLTILLLSTAIIINELKYNLCWPRPFHIDASLHVISATGFGMPSGHTAMSAAFWLGLFFFFIRKKTTHPIILGVICMLLPIGTGISRVLVGVHFISDIIAGLGISVIITLVLSCLDQRGRMSKFYESGKKPWLVFLGVLTTLMLIHHQNHFLVSRFFGILLFSLSFFGITYFQNKQNKGLNTMHRLKEKWLYILVTLIGLFLINYSLSYSLEMGVTTPVIQCVQIIMMGMWIGGISLNATCFLLQIGRRRDISK